jgi:hypothetical protein
VGRLRGVVGVLVVAVGVGGGAARADQASVSASVVAGPGSGRAGRYTTDTVPLVRGAGASLVNADITWHDVVSADFGPDDAPWCGVVDPARPESPANPRLYPLGRCPLFRAEGTPGAGGSSAIQGLGGLVAGRVYAFRCTLVPGMQGHFIVTDNPQSSSPQSSSPESRS